MEGVVLSTELVGLIALDNIVQNGYSIYSCFISRLKMTCTYCCRCMIDKGIN